MPNLNSDIIDSDELPDSDLLEIRRIPEPKNKRKLREIERIKDKLNLKSEIFSLKNYDPYSD